MKSSFLTNLKSKLMKSISSASNPTGKFNFFWDEKNIPYSHDQESFGRSDNVMLYYCLHWNHLPFTVTGKIWSHVYSVPIGYDSDYR